MKTRYLAVENVSSLKEMTQIRILKFSDAFLVNLVLLITNLRAREKKSHFTSTYG